MEFETRRMKFVTGDQRNATGTIKLYPECAADDACVFIALSVADQIYTEKAENFFEALQKIRIKLENDQIQIMCNGAAENVYPSPMQRSMGYGDMAYRLTLGKPAKLEDAIEIFDCDNGLTCTTVRKQYAFYVKWLESLK